MEWWPVYIACALLIFFVIVSIVYAREKKTRAGEFRDCPGKPRSVIAVDSSGAEVVVDLPPGVDRDKVKAVYVGKKIENAKVTILHEKVNRHDTNNSIDHDMSI